MLKILSYTEGYLSFLLLSPLFVIKSDDHAKFIFNYQCWHDVLHRTTAPYKFLPSQSAICLIIPQALLRQQGAQFKESGEWIQASSKDLYSQYRDDDDISQHTTQQNLLPLYLQRIAFADKKLFCSGVLWEPTELIFGEQIEGGQCSAS